ncbi:peptide N-acetyl-beta-D-glucosaminyl asparaginase amidase A-domain-containing protein [Leptodontidium sp. 2 PMI_412]|nr:peptide N-acetyl-beta-D-glucosaminyl asparaginase amidase A-domain-containing protein [Leptodontidium sp. 2 PMI_412]
MEDTTIDGWQLIKLLSFLGFCISLLGWVIFISSRFLLPRSTSDALPTEEGILDFYSHVAVDLFPREPQEQALSLLPQSSGALPSVESVSTSATRLNSSLTTISTASSTSSSTSTSDTGPAGATPTAVLQVFQLDAPIMGPGRVVLNDGNGNSSAGDISTDSNTEGGALCQVTLMEHEFKDSFGKPFVGNFTPPSCVGNSNTVMINFTVQSQGRQFDRLAIMFFRDTEVFRTSTAERKKSRIVWTYMKDMSHLMSLWKTSQKVIFDLPNQTNVNITGTYMTSLTATFFSAPESVNAASVILPLSTNRGSNESLPSTFTIPSSTQNATTILPEGTFPRNAKRAIASIAATGQGDEEFWWQNVLSSAVSTYNSTGGVLFGNIIFTGCVVPAFWSPMVGMQAFDLKESEIDVTSCLGLLCDGKSHTFEMKVVGLSDDAGRTAVLNQGVGSNWVVSGKIFIWTDTNTSAITTSDRINVFSSPPKISISQTATQNTTGGNDTLIYTTSVHRSLHHNIQHQNSRGNIQVNTHATSGKDSFLLSAETPYTNTYSYPLFANTSVTNLRNGSIRFDAQIDRSYHSEIAGQGASPSGLQPFANLAASSRLVETLAGTTLTQTQTGNATLIFAPGSSGGVAANGSASFGTLVGTARFGGRSSQGILGMEKDEELWYRMVGFVNATVSEDVQRANGKDVFGSSRVANASCSDIYIGTGLGLVDVGSARFLGRNLAGMDG